MGQDDQFFHDSPRKSICNDKWKALPGEAFAPGLVEMEMNMAGRRGLPDALVACLQASGTLAAACTGSCAGRGDGLHCDPILDGDDGLHRILLGGKPQKHSGLPYPENGIWWLADTRRSIPTAFRFAQRVVREGHSIDINLNENHSQLIIKGLCTLRAGGSVGGDGLPASRMPDAVQS
jgi:hypothetical protein